VNVSRTAVGGAGIPSCPHSLIAQPSSVVLFFLFNRHQRSFGRWFFSSLTIKQESDELPIN
jgi:hypothetical protein